VLSWRDNWESVIGRYYAKIIIKPETAYIITGKHDRRMWVPVPWTWLGGDRWACINRVDVSQYDCGGGRIGVALVGTTEIQGPHAYIMERMKYFDEIISALGLQGRAIIDIRTMEMIKNHCCPKALAAEMMV